MKAKIKSKSHARHEPVRRPIGMHERHEVSKLRIQKVKPQSTFTPMETGQPDQNPVPGIHNPQAAQGGLGPLNQEGEGERQNDQLAELEEIEPDK